MPRLPHIAALFIAAAALLCGIAGRAAEADFERAVQPFFNEHCCRCHDAKKQKGDLRMETLSRDFAAPPVAMHWGDIMDRISSAEMPPEDEDPPKAGDAARVVEWIAAQLKEAEAARSAAA